MKGTEKAYSFDHSFGCLTSQEEVYEKCAKDMIKELFNGYNATILAYGQTGSGKTHSMGTSHDVDKHDFKDAGIIPRAVTDIFEEIKVQSGKIKTRVSFIEVLFIF